MDEGEKEKLPKQAAERCENYRLQGFHCSESSLRAVAETLGIEISEDIMRASSGFRGGGGGYGERCGIVEAGIILISLKYGRIETGQDCDNYSYLIRILHERFLEELGSYTCRVLLPFSRNITLEHSCSYTYKKGAALLAQLLLEADELIAGMPASEKGK